MKKDQNAKQKKKIIRELESEREMRWIMEERKGMGLMHQAV